MFLMSGWPPHSTVPGIGGESIGSIHSLGFAAESLPRGAVHLAAGT
jgi:hypothetical protein